MADPETVRKGQLLDAYADAVSEEIRSSLRDAVPQLRWVLAMFLRISLPLILLDTPLALLYHCQRVPQESTPKPRHSIPESGVSRSWISREKLKSDFQALSCAIMYTHALIILHKTRPNNRSLPTIRYFTHSYTPMCFNSWLILTQHVNSCSSTEFCDIAKFHKTIDWSNMAQQCQKKICDKLGHQFDESWDLLSMKKKIALLEFLKRRTKNKDVVQW